MPKKGDLYSSTRRKHLIDDLIESKEELTALAKRYNVHVEDLAIWGLHPENRRALRGLCALSDIQAQLMLTRFRLLAATRLAQLADERADEGKSNETARKACVDLLRLNLSAAKKPQADEEEAGTEDAGIEEALELIRQGLAEVED